MSLMKSWSAHAWLCILHTVELYLTFVETISRQWERERASGLMSSHHHHSLYSPTSPPSFSFSPLHLSVFLSDSWQPVGYSGHILQIFANWLEKIHILPWLTRACWNSVSLSTALFWSSLRTCSSQYFQSLVAIKTCNNTSTECLHMNPVGQTRGVHRQLLKKMNLWKQQRITDH